MNNFLNFVMAKTKPPTEASNTRCFTGAKAPKDPSLPYPGSMLPPAPEQDEEGKESPGVVAPESNDVAPEHQEEEEDGDNGADNDGSDEDGSDEDGSEEDVSEEGSSEEEDDSKGEKVS